MPYILALDQGTTSSRAIVFDKPGNIISIAQKEFKQFFPMPGWVEHDPWEIWWSQISVAAEVLLKARINPSEIKAIGITNQRETTIIWDRKTGQPLYNAIVWQDRRTSEICDRLKKEGAAEMIHEKTGLIVDAYFSGTKIQWILDNVEGARNKAEKGELAFGTVDSWLVWNLTGGKKHITDVSNASRTMIYNIHTLSWDEELLKLLNIPISILPEVCSSSEIYAETAGNLFAAQIPIAGIAGDQQAALFGQMCTEAGMVKNTYGTGCFMLMNVGKKAVLSKNKLLTTIAWKIYGEVHYALEGSIFMGRAIVQWLRDGLGIISRSEEVEQLALSVADNGGVYLVPAFAGLGAPHWNQSATGTIVGLTRGSTAGHIARASLESICYQNMEILKCMEADASEPIKELRVDGGATVNNLLMQIQADILNVKVIRPMITETTALGAAYLAGLAVEFWSGMEDIKHQWKEDRIFEPVNNIKIKDEIISWNKAVEACKRFAE